MLFFNLPYSWIWHLVSYWYQFVDFLNEYLIIRAFDITCNNICHETRHPHLLIICLAGRMFHHTSYCQQFITCFFQSEPLKDFECSVNWSPEGTWFQKDYWGTALRGKESTGLRVRSQKLQVHVSLCKAHFRGKSCPLITTSFGKREYFLPPQEIPPSPWLL